MGTVLIADDEVDLTALTRLRLESAGIDASECYDGAAALHFIRESKPAVAILDWMMPHLTGLEVAELVRAERGTIGTRLILMTARAEASEPGFSDAHGFDRVLIKPVRKADLIAIVNEEIALSRGATPDA